MKGKFCSPTNAEKLRPNGKTNILPKGGPHGRLKRFCPHQFF